MAAFPRAPPLRSTPTILKAPARPWPRPPPVYRPPVLDPDQRPYKLTSGPQPEGGFPCHNPRHCRRFFLTNPKGPRPTLRHVLTAKDLRTPRRGAKIPPTAGNKFASRKGQPAGPPWPKATPGGRVAHTKQWGPVPPRPPLPTDPPKTMWVPPPLGQNALPFRTWPIPSSSRPPSRVTPFSRNLRVGGPRG